jgi:hypothetical protein
MIGLMDDWMVDEWTGSRTKGRTKTETRPSHPAVSPNGGEGQLPQRIGDPG